MKHISGNDSVSTYLDAYYDIFDRMKREMTSLKQTACISRDYITQLIPYH